MLTIKLTKVSPTHHRFLLELARGGRETAELETKTYLFHDLLHFAVESEAGLTGSFYGLLDQGFRYEELSDKEPSENVIGERKEAMMTERIVGVMTGVLKSDSSGAQAIVALHNLLSASGEPMPAYFSETFVTNVKERMRRLEGEWKGTPFGETMTLVFGA